MKTYRILTKEGNRSSAFEIENFYIDLFTIAQLLEGVQGVTDVRPRKIFSKSDEIHIEFNYLGQSYIVWEPYGDNSRYWIGPKEPAEGLVDTAEIENTFKRYQPNFFRVIIGNLLTFQRK